jgi:hypothetical protein
MLCISFNCRAENQGRLTSNQGELNKQDSTLRRKNSTETDNLQETLFSKIMEKLIKNSRPFREKKHVFYRRQTVYCTTLHTITEDDEKNERLITGIYQTTVPRHWPLVRTLTEQEAGKK